jgi:RES domain
VILYRCLPLRSSAGADADGDPLSFPRRLQGDGRHDAPDRYGCLYASQEPVSAVVEELARFVGTEVVDVDLLRGGRPLALASLELSDSASLLDLDDPDVLAAERLRPSLLATADRARTQAAARRLYEREERLAGLRWASSFNPEWVNVTLFDRASADLSLASVKALELGDQVVAAAASHLGLRVAA